MLISNDKIYELLQHADALVMGSVWHENYPIILLEAKNILPCYAPKCGGIPEIMKVERMESYTRWVLNPDWLRAMITFKDGPETTAFKYRDAATIPRTQIRTVQSNS